MKKLYTIALAAAVAFSASAAAPLKAPKASDVNFAFKGATVKELATKAQFERNATIGARPATTAVKHGSPAKAAISSMAELLGPYDYTITIYANGSANTANSVLSIVEGTEENEVIFQGLRYSDVDVKGIVDFAAGTITCYPQLLMEMDEDPNFPGTSMNMYLYGWNETLDQEDRQGNCVFTLNADGTISSDDVFTYGVEGLPGYSYALFDGLVLTKSSLNTKIEFSERDTDNEGHFLNTYTDYIDWCESEYVENAVVGGESLGECVFLKNFLYAPNSAITEVYNIPVQIDRDSETIFIDTWYWFAYSHPEIGSGKAAIIGLNGNRIELIEGTYSGNTISWDGIWGAYDDGWFGYYKGCTLTLPFSLGEDGIRDVAVDNENAPVEYFNLQGMRISEPAAGQIVIRRQGNKTTKLYVK